MTLCCRIIIVRRGLMFRGFHGLTYPQKLRPHNRLTKNRVMNCLYCNATNEIPLKLRPHDRFTK